jgi:putative transposase
MTYKKKIVHTNNLYFCTFTCYKWLRLFEITNLYDFIYKWFDILRLKNIQLTAYVIMPNHLHFIARIPESILSFNAVLGNGKRFLAYEIIRRLENENLSSILIQLKKAVTPYYKMRGKKHKVFETSSDIKALLTEHQIQQKLEYIHFNPVLKHWNLIDDYRLFEHSSAGFYEGNPSYKGYPVTHLSEIVFD